MNSVTFTARSGSVLFNFENRKIIFERAGGLANTTGLVSMEINMEEITDIELRQPTLMKLGGFNIIVNNIRYITKSGFDATQFAISKKSEFPLLETTLKAVLKIAGIPDFKAENEVNAIKEIY